MALLAVPGRLGLQRACRGIRQRLMVAAPRSTGQRSRVWVAFSDFSFTVGWRLGRRRTGTATSGPAPVWARSASAGICSRPQVATVRCCRGGGQVVGAAGRRPGDPQEVAFGTGYDWQVHSVATVLAAVVGAAVAGAVACGEGAVDRDVLRIGLA